MSLSIHLSFEVIKSYYRQKSHTLPHLSSSAVIPSDLSTSFSLSAGRNHTINLSVSPITTDQAEPGTIGLIEVCMLTHVAYT